MNQNLKICFGILIASSLGAWCLRPRDYSIGGVHLGDHWSDIMRRFPQAERVSDGIGMEMGGGEGRISNAFGRYTRCFRIMPKFIVAFDLEGRVEAMEGPQFELDGQPILGPNDSSEKADRYLGKWLHGTRSDADYLSYAGHVVLKLDARQPTLYALHR